MIRNNLIHGSPLGLHARSYAESAVVRQVTVGGSLLAGNVFRDNARAAVDLRAGFVKSAVVSYNTSIGSGAFLVGSSPSIVVEHNELDR